MSLQRLLGAKLPTPPQGLLFDLDGTLLDSVPDLAAAIDRMLIDLGYRAVGREHVAGWVGDGARQLVFEALSFFESYVADKRIEHALQIYQRHYGNCLTANSRLFPGVHEALQRWQRQEMHMACVTNKGAQFTEPLIDHFDLRALLPVVISGDTLSQRKPDPAPLLEACVRLGIQPQHVVMIGDSRNDVLAARAANMPVICVRHGYNHGRPIEDENPDSIVDSLLDLIFS
ncbi:MAG TPA: phosphoglycolate phosphatase [Spongiibacteraceae bacterium]|jgi:phosphoglycolate phosphatase